MRHDPYASHFPVLLHVLKRLGRSLDSILEIGSGFYSTALLHAFAAGGNCDHVVLESNDTWAKQISDLFCLTIERFSTEKLPQRFARKWGLVFIDSEIEKVRADYAVCLREYARVIVLHDSSPEWEPVYRYSAILEKWKYHRQFSGCRPDTLLLTNDDEAWTLLQ